MVAISEANWTQIIIGAVGILLAWIKFSSDKNATEAKKVAELAALEAKKAAEIGEKIHTLVNSNMGAQLNISRVALRKVAELTTDPVAKAMAIAMADEAERAYMEHQIKQAIVDKKE